MGTVKPSQPILTALNLTKRHTDLIKNRESFIFWHRNKGDKDLMCLDTIDKKTRKFKTGWKVFTHSNGKLRPWFQKYSTDIRKTYPVGKWFKDEYDGTIITFYDPMDSYKSGFHYYRSEKRARFHSENFAVVRKVQVRNIVASGIQDCSVVGVAKEIFIEP